MISLTSGQSSFQLSLDSFQSTQENLLPDLLRDIDVAWNQ